MASTKISRTVRFFRIVAEEKNGSPVPLPELNFVALLDKYRARPVSKRQHDFDASTYLFDPRDTSGRHLAIHKLRNPADFMARVSTDGTVQEVMAVDDEGAYADSAAVSFLPRGNMFGIVGGNLSAPRANRVPDWINEIQPFPGYKSRVFSAIPVVAQPALDVLDDAVGARRVTVSVRAANLGGGDDQSELGVLTRALLGDLEDARLTVTITTGKKTPGHELGIRILDFARDLGANLGDEARAQAAVLREVPASRPNTTKLSTDIVDLVEYHIAQEFEIPLSADGVRIDLTLQQIDAIARTERASLSRTLAEESGDEAPEEST